MHLVNNILIADLILGIFVAIYSIALLLALYVITQKYLFGTIHRATICDMCA